MLFLIESNLTRKLLFLVSHAIWILIAISSSVSAQDRGEKKLEAIDQFVYSGPMFIKGKRSLAEFRSLDTVLHERHEEKVNSYDEKLKDKFVLFVFDGLEIYGRIDERISKKFLPIRIKITSPKWNISGGLDVGADAKIIKMKLGLPKKRSVGYAEYCGETECVRFYIRGSRISGVEFFYYAD